MKELITEIAEGFEYNGTVCDKEDSLLIKGEYVFESKFMGSDFTIMAKFEDGDTIYIHVWSEASYKLIPEGLEALIETMIKMLINDGFDRLV